MSVTIRRARPEDCAAIAERVRRLGQDTGDADVPKIRAATLAAEAFAPAPLVHLWVAEDAAGALLGILIGVVTFSTWRDTRGLYVCDLWVDPACRGRRIGEALLAEAARAAGPAGWGFMKLEVIASNTTAGPFYARLGFEADAGDTLFVLEAEPMAALAAGRRSRG